MKRFFSLKKYGTLSLVVTFLVIAAITNRQANSNTAYAQVVLAAPSNLRASCNAAGTNVTLTWTDNQPTANNWDIVVYTRGLDEYAAQGNYPGGPSRTFPITMGESYTWSIAATDVSGGPPKSAVISGPVFECAPAPTVTCSTDNMFADWAGTSALDSIGRNLTGFSAPFPDRGQGDSQGQAGLWWGRNGNIIAGRWLNFDPFNDASTIDAYTDIPPGTYDLVCSICATNNWTGMPGATACCISDTSYKPGGVSYPKCSGSGTTTFTVPAYDIPGVVFVDTNRNGNRDGGEPTYSGATVKLSGNSSASTTSNGSGAFTFTNLVNGSYSVTVTAPANYTTTGTNPRSVTINNADAATINMGIAPTYSLAGSVFIDTNRNGTKDGGESNYGTALQVRLTGPQSANTNTSGGNYSISGLRPGTYSVTITAPANFRTTGSIPRSVTISNANVAGINLGIAPTYSISGSVFLDTNRNGVKDGGEGNFSSSVTIDINPGGSTNSSGAFTFSGLDPATYQLSLTAPANFRTTGTIPRSVTVTNANVTNINLGIAPTYSISGSVFLDTNRNGVKDGGEGNFSSSVSVDINPGGSTNTSGTFTFSGLDPATYQLSVTAPANFRTTGTIPRSVTVTNANVANINLGIAPTYTISGTVFVDTNRNGVKDGGESNYGSAIQVRLAGTSSGNTNTSGGNYSFSALEPGNYTLAITAPAAFRTTGAIPRAVTITNANVANNNLGIAPTYTISGSVYVDTNRDGNRDAGENNYATAIQIRLAGTGSGNTTTSGGNYSFSALEPGNYTLSITAPAAFRTTTPLPFSVTVTNASISGVDLGIAPTYTIAGSVYVDTNRDGNRDAGENNYGPALQVRLGGTASANTNTSGGNYAFSALEPGNYTLTITAPAAFRTTTPLPFSVTVTNGNISGVDLGIAPTYTITGTVFVDTSRDGVRNGGEITYTLSTITATLGGAASGTDTTSGGVYSFSDLDPGTYTVRIAIPVGYNATSPNPLTVIVSNANVNVEQAIALVYSISGSVFSDVNKNGVRDASESPYGGGTVTISSPAGNVTVNSGAYIVNDLPPGTYRISYTSPLPGGFVLEYPLNGPPPSFNLTVGPACNVNGTRSAVCSARGDITGANYAITNSFPWIQTIGLDARFDLGYQNVIPTSPSCGVGSYGTITDGNNTTPGIIFTGDSQASFGNGSSSQTNWVVGGSSYPDSYNTSKTALSVAQSRLLSTFQQTATSIVNVTSYPGCSNQSSCTLPNNLKDPVIRATGNLTLNSYSFPANTNTILIVTGNLTINGPITVPNNATAILSAGNNIVVNRDVGVAGACSAGNNVIEGVFIADNDFVVDGYNDCVTHGPDNMLHINGSVIVNAARGGGIFQNNRDLCAEDQQYPSITFTPRLDFLLQAPDIIRSRTLTYQEVAP